MKKILICSIMLLFATFTFAQDKPWNDETRDAAYEAPNTLFQKKWYDADNNSILDIGANGAIKYTIEDKVEGVRCFFTITGKYTRNKDHFKYTYTGAKATPNQSDLASLSARKRDEILNAIKRAEPYINSQYKNATGYYLILRLDEECMIITSYNPQTKIFNDFKWTTLYNESYKKKKEERAAQEAIELAKRLEEAKAKREAEEKARREAEEEAKREAEEKAKREAEEARIKAENKYWARIGTEKKASAEKAAAEGVKLVDLGLSVRWADRNIGARSEMGDCEYFAWAETQTKEEFAKRTYKPAKKYKANMSLEPSDDASTKRWGPGWHIPTPLQWKELKEKCILENVKLNGVWVLKVTGFNGNSIYLPYNRGKMGVSESRTKEGTANYWTNTLTSEKTEAICYSIGSGMVKSIDDVYYGLPIRAVME